MKAVGFLIGTLIEIQVPGQGHGFAVSAALDEMARVEARMSRFRPDSEISRLNAACGRALAVSPETFRVVEQALRFSRLTGGAFDAALASPAGASYRDVRLDRGARTISLAGPGMALDLGGIAKGYAVDRAVERLQEAGVEDALVSAGGDIRVLGRGADGRTWSIGVQHPGIQNGLLGRFLLVSGAAATSGGYYSRGRDHIQDPRRREPARGSLSATVLAGRALAADALSTAVYVLGPEAGIDLLQSLPGVEGLVVGRDGRAQVTAGLEEVWAGELAPRRGGAQGVGQPLSRRRLLLGALGLAGALVACCAAAARGPLEPAPTPSPSSPAPGALALADGTYSGESLSGVLVRVDVTVQAGRISDIQVVEYREISTIHTGKPTIGDQAPWPDLRDEVLLTIPARIIEKQSAAVDGVTGATMSSQTIMAAVEDALSKAGSAGP